MRLRSRSCSSSSCNARRRSLFSASICPVRSMVAPMKPLILPRVSRSGKVWASTGVTKPSERRNRNCASKELILLPGRPTPLLGNALAIVGMHGPSPALAKGLLRLQPGHLTPALIHGETFSVRIRVEDPDRGHALPSGPQRVASSLKWHPSGSAAFTISRARDRWDLGPQGRLSRL